MSEAMTTGEVHPAGEGDFVFETAGGKVRLSVTNDALTPYGGIVTWAAFTKHVGIVESLAKDCPVKRTSPNAAPVYDILQSFMLTALTDGRRFSRVERLREDPIFPELFGMEEVVGDDTVQRFFRSVAPEVGAEWIAKHLKPMWRALPARVDPLNCAAIEIRLPSAIAKSSNHHPFLRVSLCSTAEFRLN